MHVKDSRIDSEETESVKCQCNHSEKSAALEHECVNNTCSTTANCYVKKINEKGDLEKGCMFHSHCWDHRGVGKELNKRIIYCCSAKDFCNANYNASKLDYPPWEKVFPPPTR